MASRGRYISPKELGVLIADLRLASTIFQDRLLEFFERQHLVLPVARIRWPTALVIEARRGVSAVLPTGKNRQASRIWTEALRLWHWFVAHVGWPIATGTDAHGSVPAVVLTAEERQESQILADVFRLWNRFDADPELDHPLDRGNQQPGASLITFDVASCAFEPWDNFRTNIRPKDEKPLYVTDAVDTYYHDWQVLLVADALNMGMRLIFDTRREDLINLALHGDFRDLPPDVAWQEVSFQGLRGLKQGIKWAPFLDASARVETVRARKLDAISQTHHGQAFTLHGAELDDFNAAQKRAAERALAAIGGTSTQIVAFLTYLCQRWNEWTQGGRAEVAAEYKRQIMQAVRMVMHAQGRDFPSIVEDVGRVTGHFDNTLDVIFPDWTKQAREQAELSLRHGVVAKAPSADPALTLVDADVTDVLNWLERKGLWKVHLSIEAILARQFSGSQVDVVALAKEVESISTTFEHIVNALLDEASVSPAGTLMKKVQRFWNSVPAVHSILIAQHGLVSTKSAPRTVQLAGIAALTATGPNIDVARTLLAAVLYRNDGQHNAMAAWSENELHEATRVFLTALMFCRKNLLTNPPKP